MRARKKITTKWLTKVNACCNEDEKKQAEKISDLRKIVNALNKADRFKDANWLLTKCMTKKQCQRYAIYAAKQVLHIFEDKYPDDDRPRKAIKAAEKCLKNPTEKNKKAAFAGAGADAYADAADAYAAYAAVAYADADAYTAAAYAAADAAAYAAADAAGAYAGAYAAAYAAAYADAAYARKVIKTKILKYGVNLIYKESKND